MDQNVEGHNGLVSISSSRSPCPVSHCLGNSESVLLQDMSCSCREVQPDHTPTSPDTNRNHLIQKQDQKLDNYVCVFLLTEINACN